MTLNLISQARITIKTLAPNGLKRLPSLQSHPPSLLGKTRKLMNKKPPPLIATISLKTTFVHVGKLTMKMKTTRIQLNKSAAMHLKKRRLIDFVVRADNIKSKKLSSDGKCCSFRSSKKNEAIKARR